MSSDNAALPEELAPDLLEEDEGNSLFEHHRLRVDAGQGAVRVDKFLFMHLAGTSRNRIQRAADAGYILVGDAPVKRSYKVKPGDIVRVMLDRPRYETDIEAEDIPLSIIYEDADVLVVNKPAGLVVHPGVGNWHGTLLNALAWHLRDNPAFDANNPEIGLVHRIDKDTSGLLVVAKTPEAKTGLGRQFLLKTTRREYYALVWGDFAEDTGRIEGNIARSPRDRQQMTVLPAGSEQGKPAVTHFSVLERFGYVTLVKCVLETGRTHQIRAHMRHIGHPLFADERYGGADILRGTPTAKYRQFVAACLRLCPRQALHARTLGFQHPITGQAMDFSAPLPADMERLIHRWRTYATASAPIVPRPRIELGSTL